jgi:hypothetical protein
MNNIEYAWVIQRDDGWFLFAFDEKGVYFSIKDRLVMIDSDYAEWFIGIRNLQNCKPVKVKIEVVEDE